MGYSSDRMLFKRNPKDVVLKVSLNCTVCGRFVNSNCEVHDASVEDVEIKVVGIPWAKLNYIKSQCVSFDEAKQTHFDGQQYINECLKIMITEAPWGKTDDMFLLQVGKALGDELETIVPSAYQEDNTSMQDFSEIKKE